MAVECQYGSRVGVRYKSGGRQCEIRVVLRVSPLVRLLDHEAAVLALDKKRRQVTLVDPLAPAPRDPRLGVVAPKMFAFDQVYSQDDPQSDVVCGAAVDVLHAVLAGNDGCILCFGGALLGKSYTMVGLHGDQQQLGIIPSCVAWLYKSISELKSTSGMRFSVRVSAVAVDATGSNVKDLLAQYSTPGEGPDKDFLSQYSTPGEGPDKDFLSQYSTPGEGPDKDFLSQYSTPEGEGGCVGGGLRESGSGVGGGVLASLAELRAPNAESAAQYLDIALAGRSSLALSSVLQQQQHQGATIFPGSASLVYSLHVYQYAVDKNGKGGVVGGRSRLHLIDMGDMSARHGSSSLSLSSLTSVLLAIFDGQKYLPHRDNRLTGLLREALASLTCHTALVVHVSPAARHAHHNLTTLQLAARVHRTRRKKIRGMTGGSSSGSSGSRRSSGGETSAGSSSLDISSSDQSCDTVIYIGGGGPGDSTDGEHPPIFMPHHIRQPRQPALQRLRSLEQLRAQSASPTPSMRRTASASPTPTSRSVPNGKPFPKRKPCPPPRTVSNNSINSNNNSPRFHPLEGGFIRHQPGVSQINYPTAGQNVTQKPFLSTFKPFSSLCSSRQNNNVQSKSHEDNLNVVNGNQSALTSFGSSDKLHNYNAYQEPNDLVPTALSPNQEFSNVQNMRYYQLTQQQLHQQQLFNEHCLREQQKVLEKQPTSMEQQQQFIEAPLQSSSVIPTRNHTIEAPRNVKPETPSDEQWIDGPRVHKSRVVSARTNTRGEQQDETWVDGPQVSTQSNGTQVSAATSSGQPGSYGYMDDHKKSMIEKWVEVQTAQVVNQITGARTTPDNKNSTNASNNNTVSLSLGITDKPSEKEVIQQKNESVTLTHLTQLRVCDESTNGSDVDTLSEDPSASGVPALEQPSLIEELERKNLIPSGGLDILEDRSEELEPSLDHIQLSSADEANKMVVSDCSTKGRASPETTSLGGELSIDDVCSQCEALAEECEELSSLLSCEEEECKRQIHQGLATVLEEPELESAVAAEEAEMRAADVESELDCQSKLDTLRSSRAGGDDGNEADEESSEFGGSLRRSSDGKSKSMMPVRSSPHEIRNVTHGTKHGSGEMRSVSVGGRNPSGVSRSPNDGVRSNASSEVTKHVVYRKKGVRKTSTSSGTNDRECALKRDDNRWLPATGRPLDEMVVVDLPAYPVVSVDCGTQVCEQDLMLTSISSEGSCTTPASSSTGDDHPLRVLSEENLTCASTFTDSYSQMGETGDEDDSDDDSRPFSLFEVTEYAKLGQDLSTSSTNRNLRELAKIHALYQTLAQPNLQLQTDESSSRTLQPSSLLEILANSRDSLIEDQKLEVDDYESISSDFVPASIQREIICSSCGKTKSRGVNLSKSSSSGSGASWKGDISSNSSALGGGGRWSATKHQQSCKGTSYDASNFGTSSSFSYQTTPVEGYDSGHDSGMTLELSAPREAGDPSWSMETKASKCTNPKRLPVQPGITTKSGTSSSIGTTPSLGESSGYGSMARDSECSSSFSSSQDSEMDEEHRRERQKGAQRSVPKAANLPPVQVQKFTEEDIQRYESRSRTAECLQLQKEQRNQEEIAALKTRQEQLKSELADVKRKLNVPDESWSYELHVSGSSTRMLHLDSNILVLALARETEILQKRVNAAKSRVLCSTTFLHHDARAKNVVLQSLNLKINSDEFSI
ncbi:Kinesin motor domain [Trinorchestia longiramus]|nr:Kinesin motor domain [Trinorchestia longiramus]